MTETTDSAPVIRPLARVLEVHDADTYLLLLDLHGRGLDENGCVTEWVRLRDYSARELEDTAATDPKGLGRLPGPDAQAVAQQTLAGAGRVVVEVLGPEGGSVSSESFSRYVGWVWVDGQNLGDLLAAQHAVAAGKFEGDPATAANAGS